jgi:GT2 family glycosyltransferase
MTDTVRAIVVTYNTKELALALLTDLRRELKALPGSRIVVVDNASADGTPDAIEESFPDVEVRRSPTNVGFGAAVNAGARAMGDASSRWFLLVNPDARVDDGAVVRLVSAATSSPGHGLYGGRFIDVARGTNEDSVAVLPTLANLLAFATGVGPVLRRLGYRSPPRRKANSDREIEVDALPGTFLLVEADAWRAVGGFDETFFMYSEDLDLCVRVAATGRRPLFVPQASIRHIGGASSTSGGKEVMKNRSLATFLRKHWPAGRARVGCGLLVMGVGLRRLARTPFRTPSGRWETAWRERRSWLRGW